MLIYLWNYVGSSGSLSFESLLAFLIMILVVFPMFSSGILLMAKDLNTRLENNKSKSIFYHLYSLLKIFIGIIGLILGVSMGYFDITHGLSSWAIIALHSLFIYSLISVGIKILLNTIRAYSSKNMHNKS
jgi:hypothetical protein